MTPEGKVLAAIKRHLDGLKKSGEPLWYMKMHGGAMQVSGLPDLCLVYKGRSVWIEVKAEGKTATPLQVQTMQRLEAAGAVCGVATCVEEAKTILSRV